MRHLLVLFLFAFTYQVNAQIYYVKGSALNLREAPNLESKVVEVLKQYSNLQLVKEEGEWLNVKFGAKTGYVSKNYVSPGKAITSTSSYRTGAICRDGWRSSATGRGACSHHGGVSYWLTETVVTLLRVERGG